MQGFWSALAAFLTVGFAAGATAAIAFGLIAGMVRGGATQRFDERAVEWLAAHRSSLLDEVMVDITTLGDGVVLIMIVLIASIFLWITHHRWSVYILLVGLIGGKVLNTVLKAAFDRSRPSVVEWLHDVSSPSFPSGHAMGAFVTYGTVAYLVGRLSSTTRLRNVTWIIAGITVLAIGMSRVYLGVHYPSDVIAGFLAGLAWVVIVASSVTTVRFFAPRRPATAAEEEDLDGPAASSRQTV
ncbi:MAG: phosphatase PAP2 family protein [Gemmatimonadetes bacterium]|nr:phosphatase PAP2 family protein [Gemmatimonadota bacterium]